MTFNEWWSGKDARFRAAMLKEDMREVWDAAVAAERERIKAALMSMQDRTSHHNYYHCAAVALFGAYAKLKGDQDHE